MVINNIFKKIPSEEMIDMKKIILIAIGSICGLLLLSTGCIQQPEKNNGIGVVVTILPQAEFVQRIAGDHCQITVMVPPGADPHTYEPTPSQLVEVSTAQMYVKVGSPIEFELSWMNKIISMNENMLVVDSSKGINLINSTDEDEPGMDPHIWTSVKNVEIMVENIYQGLIQIDPANKTDYENNTNLYLQELRVLDSNITEILSEKIHRTFMVYHPAWGYFAKDYDLKQLSIEEYGKEPTPQQLEQLIDEAKTGNISVIFVSPEFNTRTAEVIANEIHGQVIAVDPLAENYSENMQKIARAFAEAMH
jgi:zinc transport system substrate-binding protein